MEKAPELARGAVVGACAIEREVARGRFGVVYLARHRFTGRERAVKVLLPKWSAEKEIVSRFQREAAVLDSLDHPNIVRIYGSGSSGGLLYLELEYVPSTLEQALKGGAFAPETAIVYAKQVCEALVYVHGKGIVHRDVKPENILLTAENRVKLTDLGIAKLLGAGPSLTIAGTPGFAAPEQLLRTGQPVDERADIFGLGATIHYMLLKKELPEGGRLDPGPAALLSIVGRATAEDREDRFSSAGEFLHALNALEEGRAAEFCEDELSRELDRLEDDGGGSRVLAALRRAVGRVRALFR